MLGRAAAIALAAIVAGCATVAVIEQESGFQVDPVVPGLAGIARKEIARRIGLDDADVRSDLELGKDLAFSQSRVYVRVFGLADRATGKPVPRATVPQIPLASPKITRNLTTDWFATRVDTRYRSCLARMRG